MSMLRVYLTFMVTMWSFMEWNMLFPLPPCLSLEPHKELSLPLLPPTSCLSFTRFYMLSEFDYGKHSCRRRMAGHMSDTESFLLSHCLIQGHSRHSSMVRMHGVELFFACCP